MNDDDKELVCHLFAKANELSEIVHDAAVRGQAANCSFNQYASLAKQLNEAAIGINPLSGSLIRLLAEIMNDISRSYSRFRSNI